MSSAAWSPPRFERFRRMMARHVEGGEQAGIVTLLSRRGDTRVDTFGTFGFTDARPMRRDTIFRLASVTKPIVAAAAMMLVEDGTVRLDDPVDPFLPELANRQVLRTIDGPLDDTVPAERAISLRDLLTFRAGYGIIVGPNGEWSELPIQQAIADAGLAPGPAIPALGPDEIMRRYGALPLAHQPGAQWLYNDGADLLGVLLARAAGTSLGQLLQERLFDPLGMADTGFRVPPEKLDRLPLSYQRDFATGELIHFDDPTASRWANPVFESGAGGLAGTVDDLLAFGTMMLNQGVHGDQRLLSRPAILAMTTDQLTPEQRASSSSIPIFLGNRGWGLGLAVVTVRDDLASSPGRFGWDGGYGTSLWIDPAEELVAVLMSQRLFDSAAPPAILSDFWTGAYQAFGD